jgi:hypothetical protein
LEASIVSDVLGYTGSSGDALWCQLRSLPCGGHVTISLSRLHKSQRADAGLPGLNSTLSRPSAVGRRKEATTINSLAWRLGSFEGALTI